jgi:hypothetical protein
VAVALLAVGLAAQDVPGSRSAASLRALPTFAAQAASGRHTELTVRWIVAIAPPATYFVPGTRPEINQFEIQKRTPITDRPVRERDPQVGPEEIVVVAVDAQGRELGWQHLPDPRLVRSEQPGPGGLLSGQRLYRADTELVVRVPEEMRAAALRIYMPQPTPQQAGLLGVGTIRLDR